MRNLATLAAWFYSLWWKPEAPKEVQIPDQPQPLPPYEAQAPKYGPDEQLLSDIEKRMSDKGYRMSTFEEEGNIVFISGMNPDGSKNDNRIGRFNDTLVVFRYIDGVPKIECKMAATTSPGVISNRGSEMRGGMANVVPGQYTAWRLGFHKKAKYGKNHPALVQCAAIKITRGFTSDGLPKKKFAFGLFGINIHSTQPGFNDDSVGAWSEGCLVVKDFAEFGAKFLGAISKWPCVCNNKGHIFTVTIL